MADDVAVGGREPEVEPAVMAAAVAPRVEVLRREAAPEREMALEIWAHSPEVGEIFGALAMAQAEFGDIERTLRAQVESRRTGAKYEFEYETLADVLAAIRPAMAKHGLALMQFPFTRRASVVIKTVLGHKSGQWVSNDLTASIVSTDPQTVGSGISYLRRYAAKAIVCVAPSAAEEDDGAAASGKNSAPQPAQRRSAQAPPAGTIAQTIQSVTERNGGVLIQMANGFVCSTRDPELVRAAKKFHEAGAVVELTTRPSSDPARYAPVLTEITAQVQLG